MNSSTTPIVHIIFNCVSLSTVTIGTMLSFVVLIILVCRKKIFEDTQTVLNINNYLLVFLRGIFEMMHTSNVLRGDFQLDSMLYEESWWCRIRAYIEFSLTLAIYLSCTLQAMFRLCHIAYSQYPLLVQHKTYLILIPSVWCASFILISPLLIWHGHKLIPGESTCRVSKDDPFAIAYATIMTYSLPFISLAILYFQVHRFLRRQATWNQRLSRVKFQKQQRDVLVVRRIVIVVTLLGSMGIPNAVMLILKAITGELVSIFYRVLELNFAVFVLGTGITLFYIDPQLRKVFNIFKNETKIRTITVNQTGQIPMNHRVSTPTPIDI